MWYFFYVSHVAITVWPCGLGLMVLHPNLVQLVAAAVAQGGGPRVVAIIAAFHGLLGFVSRRFERNQNVCSPSTRNKLSIVGSSHDLEVACAASDLQGLNFESCVWRAVSSHSSHHPEDVILAQFSLYVHKKWPKARFRCSKLTQDMAPMPKSTRYLQSVCMMLGQHRRRWPNAILTLDQSYLVCWEVPKGTRWHE